jgi:hypothetical protein
MNRGLFSCLLLLLAAGPLPAQFSTRIDLSSSNRYVWHGLSRAAGIVLQPSLAVGYQARGLALSTGLARHYELDRVSPGELTELGNGKGHLGEDALWVQADLAVRFLRLRSGLVRYLFRGAAPQGGGGPLSNTTEAYLAVGTSGPYFNPLLEAWWDVDRVRGGFLRASASSPVMGWPLEPFFFAALDGEVGLNLGQAPDPARPADLANFSERGLTHAALGLNFLFRAGQWPGLGSASINLALRGQLNLDDATRYNGIDRTKNFIMWLSAGVTLLFGGEARVLR